MVPGPAAIADRPVGNGPRSREASMRAAIRLPQHHPPRGRRPVSGRGLSADADAGGAALVRPPLVLAHATPDAGVLAALDRPFQAGLHHRAAPAYLFGF